jgi:probable F420-dependent oxidoreductase
MANHRPFRFGVISEQVLPATEWLEHVQRVEKFGFDTFLIRDHFVPDFFGDQLAPLPALMAAAMATTKLRVGTLVLDNDYRHPVMLAKEAATIDYLSGGRLELGIGAGWLRREYESAGIPFERTGLRIDRLIESIQVLKGLLGGGPFSFNGEHYSIADLEIVPRPAQQPRLPILIGAGKPRMLRLAGREADIVSILTTSVVSGTLAADPSERLAGEVARKLEHVREGAGDRFDQIELNLIPTVQLVDDRDATVRQFRVERGWDDLSDRDVLEMPSVFIGSLDEIVQDMRERRERYGFSYYVFSDTQIDTAAPIVERLAGK